MSRRLALLAAAAALGAGAAQAQRVEIDSARKTSYAAAIPTRPGEVIASELSDSDSSPFPGWRAEHFLFTGRAGETVTVQVQSDIPGLVVSIVDNPRKEIVRGPANAAPLKVVLPRDGTFFVVVGANGPQRNGKYLLTLGSGDATPAPPAQAAPVQVAATPPAPAAPAQRVDIVAQLTGVTRPYPVQTGQLIAGEISPGDYVAGPDWNGDVLTFNARAGEVVTAQLKSDIPGVEVHIHAANSHTGKALVEGPAAAAPLRFVAPKAGAYMLFVHAKGPGRFGKYLLSLGSDQGAPSFDSPKPPPPVQVAEAPKPAPAPHAPPKPAAPAALPKLTPPPGMLAAEVGGTVSRPAGKPGASVDLYAFIGEAGAVLNADTVGTGGYEMTLYTPEGAQMLAASGTDTAKLSAVLPQDAVYILAVAREDAAKPYKLSLGAESPDPFQWSFREWAGYETLNADGTLRSWTCWVTPGAVLRYTLADGQVQTQTLRPGGSGRWDYIYEGRPNGFSFTTRIEGTTFVRTTEMNTKQTWSLDDPPKPHGAYRGYLCR